MIPTYVGFALYLALSIGDLLSLSDPADVDDIVTSRGLPSALRAANLTEVMSISHRNLTDWGAAWICGSNRIHLPPEPPTDGRSTLMEGTTPCRLPTIV
jgi:hypothetical protein